MSTPNKFLLIVAFLATGAALIYETRVVARDRSQLEARAQKVSRLEAEVQAAQAQRNRDRTATAPAAAILKPPTTENPAATKEISAAQEWIARTKRLRELLAAHPDQAIPELKLLEDRDWLFVAQSASLDDEMGMKKAFGALRAKAKSVFAGRFSVALRAFMAAAGNDLPESTAAFLPYFNPPIDPAILDRYAMVRNGKVGEKGESILVEKSPVDLTRDGKMSIGLNSEETETEMVSGGMASLLEANEAYKQAHAGQPPPNMVDALPYLTDPAMREKVQDIAQATATFAQLHGAHPANPEQLRPYLKNPDSEDFLSPPAATTPSSNFVDVSASLNQAVQQELTQAAEAYRLAHNGQMPAQLDPEELRPYVKDPAKLDEFLRVLKAEAAKRMPAGG